MTSALELPGLGFAYDKIRQISAMGGIKEGVHIVGQNNCPLSSVYADSARLLENYIREEYSRVGNLHVPKSLRRDKAVINLETRLGQKVGDIKVQKSRLNRGRTDFGRSRMADYLTAGTEIKNQGLVLYFNMEGTEREDEDGEIVGRDQATISAAARNHFLNYVSEKGIRTFF